MIEYGYEIIEDTGLGIIPPQVKELWAKEAEAIKSGTTTLDQWNNACRNQFGTVKAGGLCETKGLLLSKLTADSELPKSLGTMTGADQYKQYRDWIAGILKGVETGEVLVEEGPAGGAAPQVPTASALTEFASNLLNFGRKQCPSGQVWYQPPMPPAEPGTIRAQVMPPGYCVPASDLQTSAQTRPWSEQVQPLLPYSVEGIEQKIESALGVSLPLPWLVGGGLVVLGLIMRARR